MTCLRLAPWCLLYYLLSADAFAVPSQRRAVHKTVPFTKFVNDISFSRGNLATTEMSRLEDHDRVRKRDVFQRDIVSKIGFSSRRSGRKSIRSSLRMRKDKNENEKEDVQNRLAWLDEAKAKVDESLQRILDFLPPSVQAVLTKVSNFFPTLRLALLSFLAGSVLTTAAILVPVYASVESLSEPVTLFETILADLEMGYVDPVDTNRLFETGVSAMLRSLDPYTEFEAREEAQQLTEGIMGRYGGVGLVIAGTTPKDMAKLEKMTSPPPSGAEDGSKLLPQDAINDNARLEDGDMSSSIIISEDLDEEDDDDDGISLETRKEQRRAIEKARSRGIRVVNAFEGFAFDYGMRVGDKLVGVDDLDITPVTSVDQVRNVLRGEPGTMVSIRFEREGVKGEQTVTMPRRVVQLRDVKLATLIGKPSDGIGYVSLSGFAANSGQEVRQAILALEQAAIDASDGEHTLKGLVLDLRGNPGGLLTSAVDVASLLVPKGSDIVSAKGRGFPGVTYRSRVDPILDPSTKLAVLINRGTASAAEIVSGAVQDLDAGVIIGGDRTFGKGLVQNVEDLPFNTALKFTVAKYYTPSGRCIQGINYKEGGGLAEGDGKYQSSKVAEKDRQNFYTTRGRIVKDGGGVEADYKVEAPKASVLEITLLRSDVLSEFAAQWSRKNQLGNNFEVDDNIYREFQDFVEEKRKAGDIKLEGLYASALTDLKRALKQSGYKGSEREVEQLQNMIVREIKNDFEKYKADIKEDISSSILARYLPESMILERGLKTDKQVQAAVDLLGNQKSFNKVLAQGSVEERIDGGDRINVASAQLAPQTKEGATLQVEW